VALIDCVECGNKISNLARACPKCGHPTDDEGEGGAPAVLKPVAPDKKSRSPIYYVVWIAGVVLALFFGSAIVAGIMDSSKRSAIANDPNAIHAGDVVTMMESAYGCEYPSTFSKALEHRNAGELAAWAKITGNDPFCFYGGNLKANQKWTVLQVRDNMMQISLATASQAISDMKRSDHDYWTLVEWGTKERPE